MEDWKVFFSAFLLLQSFEIVSSFTQYCLIDSSSIFFYLFAENPSMMKTTQNQNSKYFNHPSREQTVDVYAVILMHLMFSLLDHFYVLFEETLLAVW